MGHPWLGSIVMGGYATSGAEVELIGPSILAIDKIPQLYDDGLPFRVGFHCDGWVCNEWSC